MVKMKCLIKEEEDQIALNKGPASFNQGKERAQEAKPKGPGVSHKRKHCLIYFSTLQCIFHFFNDLSWAFTTKMIDINKDCSMQQTFNQ